MTNLAFSGVRTALPQDEDQLYDMLLTLHSENGVFSVSEPKVRAFIRHSTERRGGIIGVIDGPSSIEASVGLELSQWWYTEQWCLTEHWNFVHPDHRKTTHAATLIEWSKWAAEQLAMPLLMGIISTKRVEAKVNLYGRKMTNVGAMFMSGLPQDLELTNGRQ